MDGAVYDWTTKEPQIKQSDYLDDCLHYLETTFFALQILPVITHVISYTVQYV